MQQLTFAGAGRLVWEDVPAPELSTGSDALVRPSAVATCDLDAAVMAGRAPLPGPFAFGHEFVADVIAVGDSVATVAARRPGDRAVPGELRRVRLLPARPHCELRHGRGRSRLRHGADRPPGVGRRVE